MIKGTSIVKLGAIQDWKGKIGWYCCSEQVIVRATMWFHSFYEKLANSMQYSILLMKKLL